MGVNHVPKTNCRQPVERLEIHRAKNFLGWPRRFQMNAPANGILSKEVLVRGLNLKESSHELTALHQRFWQELKPVGPVEEMLVDQVVTAHWRLRRALAAESGEIALSVDEGEWRSRLPSPNML